MRADVARLLARGVNTHGMALDDHAGRRVLPTPAVAEHRGELRRILATPEVRRRCG